jgi:hypothetical protein
MFYTLVPFKLALSFLATYFRASDEKDLIIVQGCAFLLLGLFWSKRSRSGRQDAKLRTSDDSLAVSSGVLATQLLRVADGFSIRQIPPSESSPSLISIPCRPKQADIFAHSVSTTGLFYRSPRSGSSRSPLTG